MIECFFTATIELSDEEYPVLEMFSMITLQPPNEYAKAAVIEIIVQDKDTDRHFDSTKDIVKLARENVPKYIGREKQI